MIIKWYKDRVLSAVRRQLLANLDEAGAYTVRKIRERISTQGPPRSSPGESPHADTDALWHSYQYNVNPATLNVEVYSPLPYALALEFGTSKMEPRPYLRPVLDENGREIGTIVATGYSV